MWYTFEIKTTGMGRIDFYVTAPYRDIVADVASNHKQLRSLADVRSLSEPLHDSTASTQDPTARADERCEVREVLSSEDRLDQDTSGPREHC